MEQFYELGEKIGFGAFGDVFVARHKVTNEVRALKRMVVAFDYWPKVVAMRDIQSMLHLSEHPNLVPLYEVHRSPTDEVWLVFEYLALSLHDVLEYGNPLTHPVIAKWMRDLFSALDYMHGAGYLHRDVKTENLLLSKNGTLKLADFNLARGRHENDFPLTTYISTRWYRAPEVMLGLPYGPPIDVFAAGCILAEMHTRQPLFQAESEIDLFHRIVIVLGHPPKMERFARSNKLGVPPPLSATPIENLWKMTGMSQDALELLAGLLHVDPVQRWPIRRALQHSFFSTSDEVALSSPATTVTSMAVTVTPDTTKESTAVVLPNA